ncbi:MAG TPA: hypothetical protein VF660_03370 [Actinomycetota bacterium]
MQPVRHSVPPLVAEEPVSTPAPAAQDPSTLRDRFLVPIGAFLASNLVLWGVARGIGMEYFDARVWVKWDASYYLSIARRGYTFFSCGVDRHLADMYGAHQWCGNAGWFPGYPAMVRVVEQLGLSGPTAGVLVSTIFQLAILVFVWNAFLISRSSFDRVLGVLLAAFFFGSVYYRAVFPIAMTAFFILLSLWYLNRERWVPAGLAGFAAAFCYPTGFVLAGVQGAWILWHGSRTRWKQRGYRLLATSGLTVAGLGAVMVFQKATTGVWGAFFKVQARYGYGGFHNPLHKLVKTVRPVFSGGLSVREASNWQTLVVAVFMVSLLASVGLRLRRGEHVEKIEQLALITALAFWLFPLIVGQQVHLYRAEALLLPAVLAFHRVPKAGQMVFLWVALWLAVNMALLFYRGVLV